MLIRCRPARLARLLSDSVITVMLFLHRHADATILRKSTLLNIQAHNLPAAATKDHQIQIQTTNMSNTTPATEIFVLERFRSSTSSPIVDAIRKRVQGVFFSMHHHGTRPTDSQTKRPSYIRRCVAHELREVEDEKIRVAMENSEEFRKLKREMKCTGMISPQAARQVLNAI
jgi:hypothetical protein